MGSKDLSHSLDQPGNVGATGALVGHGAPLSKIGFRHNRPDIGLSGSTISRALSRHKGLVLPLTRGDALEMRYAALGAEDRNGSTPDVQQRAIEYRHGAACGYAAMTRSRPKVVRSTPRKKR
jgi:hypothetical protein